MAPANLQEALEDTEVVRKETPITRTLDPAKTSRLWPMLGALLLAVVIAGCGSAATPTPTYTPTPTFTPTPQGGFRIKRYSAPPPMTIDVSKRYLATLETTKGNIVIELFPKEAPMTVNNFVFLSRDGYYDGVKFHRIIKGFMVQTGDPMGTGRGGPGYTFPDEPVTRDYTPGIVAMANAGPNTNGSQFFIMHGSAPNMPKNYTIFGKVIQGMDVVNQIANTPVGPGFPGEVSFPLQDVHINRIIIEELPASQ